MKILVENMFDTQCLAILPLIRWAIVNNISKFSFAFTLLRTGLRWVRAGTNSFFFSLSSLSLFSFFLFSS